MLQQWYSGGAVETVQSVASAAQEEDHPPASQPDPHPSDPRCAPALCLMFFSSWQWQGEGISTFSISAPSHVLPLFHCSQLWSSNGNLLFEGPLITCRAFVKRRHFLPTVQQILPQQVVLAEGQKHKEGINNKEQCKGMGKKQHCHWEKACRAFY